MYDITIIGAGPAGSTLARLLGDRFKILLLDRRDFQNNSNFTYEKCCGGLLAPDSQKMLAKLGLGVPKEILVGPQLFSVRTIDMDNSIEKYYQRHYINVDRIKFDRWLISLIPSQVNIKYNCLFKSFKNENNNIKINYFENGKETSEYTKILVGADGANSILRKNISDNHIYPDQYIAIQEWFEVNKPLPYYSAIFDMKITDFYSWTIPKENMLLVGSALIPNKNPHNKFELLKKKLSMYGFNYGKSIKKNGAFIYRTKKLNHSP
ncbi:kynurenine 3-monooxygenase [Clostridium tepidiprofundi DSM 19306]|uniref:Kynurenine 3-monooxygenase n=1 Tax=Clostridium tepidiprofundi DSM 19306 TaxID=1121338 RepID=A0A151AVZ2_9CLOT|nr:FAD-binding protein [Clostridium tepidiprofundi]KYH31577.1 kynurenine 3-monooxygenase [Clostridium tepidiprofundi DSM 19306]